MCHLFWPIEKCCIFKTVLNKKSVASWRFWFHIEWKFPLSKFLCVVHQNPPPLWQHCMWKSLYIKACTVVYYLYIEHFWKDDLKGALNGMNFNSYPPTPPHTHAHNNSPLHNNHHPAKSKSQIPDSYYRKHPFGHPFKGAMLLKINEISILFSQSLTNRKLCERRCACRPGTALLLALGRALIQGLYLIVSVGQVPAIISN